LAAGKRKVKKKQEGKGEEEEREKSDSTVDVRICKERPMNAIAADRANITTGSAAIISQISQDIRYSIGITK
jgi:hypothetical protein